MKIISLFLFMPFVAVAQVTDQAGNFSTSVSIAKKSPVAEVRVDATDDGNAWLPIKLSVQAKCAGRDKWTDLRQHFPEIPKRVCMMFEERTGDWQEGRHTLTIHWVIRDESKSKAATDADAKSASAPCSRGQKAVIDLREVCD